MTRLIVVGWSGLLILLSFGLSALSEQQGYKRGMVAATIALEPHLCLKENP